MAELVTAVEVGETFTAETMRGGEKQRVSYTVAESCGANDGHWYCVTHDELFANQLAKDSHISRGTHRLAWACWTHGPEKP